MTIDLELVEKIAAKPWFLIAFTLTFAVLWFGFGVDVSNIFISIVTAELVLLGLGQARRSNLGLHAKLDEMILTSQEARDDLAHVEDLTEEEIEDRRK